MIFDVVRDLLSSSVDLEVQEGLMATAGLLAAGRWRSFPKVIELLSSTFFPRLDRIDELRSATLAAAGMTLSNWGLGFSCGADWSWFRQFHKKIVSSGSWDRIAAFCGALELYSLPSHGLMLSDIASDICLFWELPGKVSKQAYDSAKRFSSKLGLMNWVGDPPLLRRVLEEAKRLLTVNNEVAVEVASFVYSLAERYPYRIPEDALVQIAECVQLMCRAPRDEARGAAVRVASALLPYWGAATPKEKPAAVAVSLARLDSVDVFGVVGREFREAFAILEVAFESDALWRSRIEKAARSFWARIGDTEFPEIEDWRYVFGGTYYD